MECFRANFPLLYVNLNQDGRREGLLMNPGIVAFHSLRIVFHFCRGRPRNCF